MIMENTESTALTTSEYVTYVGIPGFTYVSKTPLHIDKLVLSAKIGNEDLPIYSQIKIETVEETKEKNEEGKEVTIPEHDAVKNLDEKGEETTDTKQLTFFRGASADNTNLRNQFTDLCEKSEEGDFIYTHSISRSIKQDSVENKEDVDKTTMEDNGGKQTWLSRNLNCFGFIALKDRLDVDITITFKMYSIITEDSSGNIISGGKYKTTNSNSYTNTDYKTNVHLGDWITVYNPSVTTKEKLSYFLEAGTIKDQYCDVRDSNEYIEIPSAGWFYKTNDANSKWEEITSKTTTYNVEKKITDINDFVNTDYLKKLTFWEKKPSMYGVAGRPNVPHSDPTYLATVDNDYYSNTRLITFMDTDVNNTCGRTDVLAVLISGLATTGAIRRWAGKDSKFTTTIPYRLLGAMYDSKENRILRVVNTRTGRDIDVETDALIGSAQYYPFLMLSSIRSNTEKSKLPTLTIRFYPSNLKINPETWKYLYDNLPYMSVTNRNMSAKLTYNLSTSDNFFCSNSANCGDVKVTDSSNDKYFMPSDTIPLLAPKTLINKLSENAKNYFNRLTHVPNPDHNTDKDNTSSGLKEEMTTNQSKNLSAFLEITENKKLAYGFKIPNNEDEHEWSYRGRDVNITDTTNAMQCSLTANEFKNGLLLNSGVENTFVIGADDGLYRHYSEVKIVGAPSIFQVLTLSRGRATKDKTWGFLSNKTGSLTFNFTSNIQNSHLKFNNKTKNVVYPYYYFKGKNETGLTDVFAGINATLLSSKLSETNINWETNYAKFSPDVNTSICRTFMEDYKCMSCSNESSITVQLDLSYDVIKNGHYLVIKITGVTFEDDSSGGQNSPKLLEFKVGNNGMTQNGITMMYVKDNLPSELTITPNKNGYITSICVFPCTDKTITFNTKGDADEILNAPYALAVLEKIVFPSIICGYENFNLFGSIKNTVTSATNTYIEEKKYRFVALPELEDVSLGASGGVFLPIAFYKITDHESATKDDIVFCTSKANLPFVQELMQGKAIKKQNTKWTNISLSVQANSYLGDSKPDVKAILDTLPESLWKAIEGAKAPEYNIDAKSATII